MCQEKMTNTLSTASMRLKLYLEKNKQIVPFEVEKLSYCLNSCDFFVLDKSGISALGQARA